MFLEICHHKNRCFSKMNIKVSFWHCVKASWRKDRSFKNRLAYNPNKTPINNCRTLMMMMMMMMMMNLGTLSYQLRPLSTTTPFDLPHLLPDIKFGGPKVWHLFGCMRMMRVFKKNEILDFALALFCTLRRFIWESVLHQQKWVLKQTRHSEEGFILPANPCFWWGFPKLCQGLSLISWSFPIMCAKNTRVAILKNQWNFRKLQET